MMYNCCYVEQRPDGDYCTTHDMYVDTACPHERIAELEDELDRFRNGYKGGCYACEMVGEKNVELERRVESLLMELAELRAMFIQRQPTALEQENERLREERNLIADYISNDPPFDTCAGVDLHERAAEYSAERYAEESSAEDYYRAFLDCCKAALNGEAGG